MIFAETRGARGLDARVEEFGSTVSRITVLAASTVLPLFSMNSAAQAACAPGAICITQATDVGDASVVGSYSWAITQANAGGNQTIGFDPATFTGLNPTLTLTGTSAQTPRLSASVTIDGSSVANLTIDGSNQREILFIRPDAPDAANPISVFVRDVTLANGTAKGGNGASQAVGAGGGMGAGGAIFVGSGVALVAENVTLSGNNAKGGNGGINNNAAGGHAGGGGGGLNGGNGAVSNISYTGGGGGGMGAGNNGSGTKGGGSLGGVTSTPAMPAGAGGAYSGGGGATLNVGSYVGGAGGYGGGGGGAAASAGDYAPRGGNGGFGGGGGGGANNNRTGGDRRPGGDGGFGGGAGGGHYDNQVRAKPGFGGGQADFNTSAGGGAGFGGAIFVENGGAVTLAGVGIVSGGSAAGGTTPGFAANSGMGLGSGFYLHGTTALNVAAGAGQTMTITDNIDSDAYADPGRFYSMNNADPAGDGMDGGVIQTGAGTLVLRGANTYAGGTTVNGGTVNAETDSNLGHVSGGVILNGGTLQWGASFDTARSVTLAQNNGTLDTNGSDGTLNGVVSGIGGLTKSGAGTLTLTNVNTYQGDTTISVGTLALNGTGTIAVSNRVVANGIFDISATSAGASIMSLAGVGAVNFGGQTLSLTQAHDTFSGQFAGMGDFFLAGGQQVLSGDSSTFSGASTIQAGILSVNGILGGAVAVLGGRLQGNGTVGDTLNFLGGIIAPGNSIGTLTVAGNYTSNGGGLEIEAELGTDNSPTDLLHITGDSLLGTGPTQVHVFNVGGVGGETTSDGIRIVEIDGVSNADAFALAGPAIGGAYRYDLFQNGVIDPTDGDWYLRSAGLAPTIPVYENYPQVLLGMVELPTLQQRVGTRHWTAMTGTEASSAVTQSAIWTRIEGAHGRFKSSASTSDARFDSDTALVQVGLDGQLVANASGMWVGGITAQYGRASADIFAGLGDGANTTTSYGIGATLTWYGENGFYVDGQAQIATLRSDLSAAGIGSIGDGIHGSGYALSLEAGHKTVLGGSWSLTPQAQLAYASVDFDRFTDPFGAAVSLRKGDSLKGRLGIATDYEPDTGTHVYGIANLTYEFLDGTAVAVSGIDLAFTPQRFGGELGVGGAYAWADGKYALHGEALAAASFDGGYALKGTVGFTAGF